MCSIFRLQSATVVLVATQRWPNGVGNCERQKSLETIITNKRGDALKTWGYVYRRVCVYIYTYVCIYYIIYIQYYTIYIYVFVCRDIYICRYIRIHVTKQLEWGVKPSNGACSGIVRPRAAEKITDVVQLATSPLGMVVTGNNGDTMWHAFTQ